MHVLFCPHRDAQHLYPMVPLAWAFRAAGHEVRIAGPPALADAIVHTGLPAVIVGRDKPAPNVSAGPRAAIVYQHQLPPDWPVRTHLLTADQRATIELLCHNSAEAAEYTVDELIAFARSWRPDLIVRDTAGFAGAVTAAAIDVPDVRYLTGVGLRPMELRVGGREPLPAFARLFERRGLPVRAIPAMTIDPSPPSLRLPVADPYREVRYVPYNGPGTEPAWLSTPSRRPRICVTWGLSIARMSRQVGWSALDPFRAAVDALAGLNVEMIVVTTREQLERLGPLPGNTRAIVSVPLQFVLPHCALIVHQAGDGTALTAAALGVPQLAITRKPDPALTGSRLAGVGAAIHLRYQELERDPDATGAIRTAGDKLLADSAYAESAVRLRAEIELQPAPAELVSVLETLTGQRG